jgi:hypothetical protein
MTPIPYDIISSFKGIINGEIIYDENYYLVLEKTSYMLNDTLRDIDIKNEDEFIQNFIDAILELYYYTEFTDKQIIGSISKSLDNFKSKSNDDLKNLKFEIYTSKGKQTSDSLDYINERLETGYYTT